MDRITPETCDECGFDGGAWRRRDVASYFGALGEWWRLALAGVGHEHLNQRPAPGVWSTLEYGVHVALVTGVLRAGLEAILAEDGVALPDPPASSDAGAGDEPSTLDREQVVDDLEREAAAMVALIGSAPDDAWAHVGTTPSARLEAEAVLLHAAHDASHHAFDVARGLAAIGAAGGDGAGTVAQINASGGGVPKLPVETGTIEWSGLAGDHQADRKHHGRPFQALCLWSSDVIERLADDGHPITAGAAGENLTLAGLDWDTMRPGVLLEVGDVLAEISFPATPCAKQTRWFTDGDFGRIDHDRNPDLTRWYAWVRRPGTLRPGDPVSRTPPGNFGDFAP